MVRSFLVDLISALKERPHWLIPVVGGAGLYKKCSVLGKARKELPAETRKYGALAAGLFEGSRLSLPIIFSSVQYASTGHVSMHDPFWILAGASYLGFTAIFSEMGEIIDSNTLEAKLGNNSATA